jgi:hypothetical protein
MGAGLPGKPAARRTAECCCGQQLREVRLPADLAALAGRKTIWVHAGTRDILCYPDSSSPEDRAATAEPASS